MSGIAPDRRAEFQAWMSCIFDWNDNSQKIEGTLPIPPEHFDRRISLQQGCFTFHAFKPGHAVLEKTNQAVWELFGIEICSNRCIEPVLNGGFPTPLRANFSNLERQLAWKRNGTAHRGNVVIAEM
jgi:hypothetical protein